AWGWRRTGVSDCVGSRAVSFRLGRHARSGGPVVRRGARARPAARGRRGTIRRKMHQEPLEFYRVLPDAEMVRREVRTDGTAFDRNCQPGILPAYAPARRGPGIAGHVPADPPRRGGPRGVSPRSTCAGGPESVRTRLGGLLPHPGTGGGLRVV